MDWYEESQASIKNDLDISKTSVQFKQRRCVSKRCILRSHTEAMNEDHRTE